MKKQDPWPKAPKPPPPPPKPPGLPKPPYLTTIHYECGAPAQCKECGSDVHTRFVFVTSKCINPDCPHYYGGKDNWNTALAILFGCIFMAPFVIISILKLMEAFSQ